MHSSVVGLQVQNRSVTIAVSIAPEKKMRVARNFWEIHSPEGPTSALNWDLGGR